MLSVILLKVIMLSAIMLIVIMLSVILLKVIILNVIVMNVIKLSVIMLSVIRVEVRQWAWNQTKSSWQKIPLQNDVYESIGKNYIVKKMRQGFLDGNNQRYIL